MTMYRFVDEDVSSDEAKFDACVKKAYQDKYPPLCMCKSDGVPMYIAKIGDMHVIKRLPNSGSAHHISCKSYEPPLELSGLGQVEGSAIQENTEDGTTVLKFDFALSKSPGKQPPKSKDKETDAVKTDGTKLTLRSTLHYLWEQAGFNRYTPAMKDKRTWYVIRKYLLEAAANKLVKKQNLKDIIYIPETFFLDKKNEIDHRRILTFKKVADSDKGARKLMIVIAEVKDIAESRYGHKVLFKHISNCPFMINEDLYARLIKRFAGELELWDALDDGHLIMIGTFGVSQNGIPSIEEASLMNVSKDWIPFENSYENTLLKSLTDQGRRFIKGLRYNMPSDKTMATAVLSDVSDPPVALYILNSNDERLVKQTNDLIQSSDLGSWVWNLGEIMPPFNEASL